MTSGRLTARFSDEWDEAGSKFNQRGFSAAYGTREALIDGPISRVCKNPPAAKCSRGHIRIYI